MEHRYIPPWKQPYLIGIAGCSGSGKTSIAASVISQLNVPWTVLLSMDNFYRPLDAEQRKLAYDSRYDFDSPESIDLDLLWTVLRDLKEGKKVQIPTYSFEEHNRTGKWLTVYGANVIIVEGLYALYDPRIADLLDLKVFVDTAFDICLARRLNRDILHRGREVVLSIHQWDRFVKPNYERNIKPTSKTADILIPRGLDNTIGINMLISHIRRQLLAKSSQHLTDFLSLTGAEGGPYDPIKDPNVFVLQQTCQVTGIYTVLLDARTRSDEFIFYFDRLSRMLISRALDELTCYTAKSVTTPTGAQFKGSHLPFDELCAVTVIRGGQCLQRALKATVPTIRLGRLLLQSDARTGEPQLHTMSLPPSIDPKPTSAEGSVSQTDQDTVANSQVLLVDAQISSGAAITMATAILLDHDVKPHNITVVACTASEIGLRRFRYAHPKVRVVVGHVDRNIVNHYFDRLYFGT